MPRIKWRGYRMSVHLYGVNRRVQHLDITRSGGDHVGSFEYGKEESCAQETSCKNKTQRRAQP